MNRLKILSLSKSFGKRTLFKKVNLEFEKKGFYLLLGDSGCGKSTFLDLISGIDDEYGGSIIFDGRELRTINEEERADIRLKSIGYIRQESPLMEEMNVISNVLFPYQALGGKMKYALFKAEKLLSSLGLLDKAYENVNHLSGGERQRIVIGREMVKNPKMVLADEPTGSLDESSASKVYEILKKISKKTLLIMVSHDEEKSIPYADFVITFKEQSMEMKKAKDWVEDSSLPSDYILPTPKKKKGIPLFLWLKQGFCALKHKKWRSIFAVIMTLISLLSLGLSSYLKRDLGNSISSSLLSFCGDASIVMEKRDGTGNFSKYGASRDIVKAIADSHSDILDYGVTYLADFESFFKDDDKCYIKGEERDYTIPSLTSRSVNDFAWLDEREDHYIFPSYPSSLRDDEVVLGLSYSEMVHICTYLEINPTYNDLGDYFINNQTQLYFRFENKEWSYDDDQVVSLAGVCESKVPCFYHYNHRWNEYFLKERMRFPSSIDKDDSVPWMMREVYYLEPKKSRYEMVDKLRKEGYCDSYVFDCCSYEYERTFTDYGFASPLKRTYVYINDGKIIPYEEEKKMASLEDVSSYYVTSNGSYVYYPEALLSGWSNPFFLSKDDETIDKCIDSFSFVPLEEKDMDVIAPGGAVVGSCFKPMAKSLSFSSNFSSIKQGEKPKNIDEVCLSDSLANKLQIKVGDKIFLSGMVASYEIGDNLSRDYRKASVIVAGIIKNDYQTLYGLPYWNIDFFRDRLGMDASSLIKDKIVFELKKMNTIRRDLSYLEKNNPSYSFSAPYLSISESIEETIGYLSSVLDFASVFSSIIALASLSVISYLVIKERKKEGEMLFEMGIRKSSLPDMHAAPLSLIMGAGTVLALGMLLSLEWVLFRYLKISFSSATAFVFDPIPLAIILVASILSFSLIYFLTRLHFYRKRGRLSA